MAAIGGPRTVTDGLVLELDGSYIGLTATVDVLLVAGGGGGGMDMGGGGGAGGVLYTTSSVTHGNTYAVVVGAGGAGARARDVASERGANGTNSTFNGLTAIGGGGGASFHDNSSYPAGSGGSGGGASGGAQSPSGGSGGAGGYGGGAAGTGTAGQGYAGSFGIWAWYPGGGGGAGGAGSTNPANGGPGICYPTMSPYYFGGGGGGSAYAVGQGGTGGIGGGGGGALGDTSVAGKGGQGGGSALNAGVNGTRGLGGSWANVPGGSAGANTGGGGGGGSHYNSNNAGGAGGSGIVIIRYLGRQRATGGTVSSLNGYTIHTFLTNGTFDTTAWIDTSGNGNTGTLVNGPIYDSANYGSISFDGSNDYINVTNTGQFDFPGDFTVCVWLYPVSYALTYQTIIDTYPGGVTNGWIFTTMNGGTQAISWYTETCGWSQSSASVDLNTWNFLVATRTGTTTKVYKNAVQILSVADSSNIRGGALCIGRGLNDSYGPVNGKIGNVAIYKGKSFTIADIQQNYNALSPRYNSALEVQTQINNTSMPNSIVNVGGTGMQGAGSSVITSLGVAAPSVSPGTYTYNSSYFSTHGGHTGSNSFPMYWGVYLGTLRAVNQLIVYVHPNSWGYFVLEGSTDCGTSSGFANVGTWSPIRFVSSNNGSNNQNMGGYSSGRLDGASLTFTYANNAGYLAYRIRILDNSQSSQSLGTSYGGSAGYSWQLNRV